MTFQQMFDLSNSLLDKVGSPYFTESEFDNFCNIAYNDLIEQEYNKYEINHEHSVKLDKLLVTYTKIGTEISLTADVTNFRYLVRINGEFNDTCNGLITRNIRQAKNNNIDILKQDPFNRPTTKEPLFLITTGPKIEVLPTATKINIVYLREPQKINSDTNPTGIFELADYIAEEIVEMAVRKQDVNVENYNQAQAINNEIAQRNGVFE